jgi:hypothetical protein
MDDKDKKENEIRKVDRDEGLDEQGKREAEEMDQEELDRQIEEAEERIRRRPLTWRPGEGERKAVKVLEKVQKDTEFGSTPFFTVLDLRSSQKLSLLAHGVLLKNLEVGKSYLLQYEGKIENGDKSYHRWLWEELK